METNNPTLSALNAQSPIATAQPSTGNAATAAGGTLGKDEFLKLLVTQLTHQDPLDPTDPTEFVTQLSQLSSLEQLVNLSQGMEVMAVAQSAGTSAQVVNFVGRNVTFRGDTLTIKGGGVASDIGIQLEAAAAAVKITVKDGSGKVVRTLELGQHDKGKHTIAFDGKGDDGKPLPDGEYTVSIAATDPLGESITASARNAGLVVAVSYDKGYPELVLDDGRRVALGQVLEVLQAPSAAGPPTTEEN